MAIYTLLEYWCNVSQHHEQYLCNSSQKFPFYMIQADENTKVHKICKIVVRKTWFVSTLHQNYPCSSSFGGRRGIHGEFGKSLQTFDFLSNFVSLFWPFSRGLMHPKYQSMNHAIKNHPGPDYQP